MKINSDSHAGQALWLGIANFMSFSFGLISAAILSRFLSVDEYGTYKQVLYVYSTLLTVFTLGLPRAYSFFLARKPVEEGRSAVNKINRIFLLLGSLFSVSLFGGADMIAGVLKNPDLALCLKYFSPTPMFLLPIMGLESIMATYRKTSYAAGYVAISRLFTLICVIVPVIFCGRGAKEAVIGFTIASALCCIVGMWIERVPFRWIVNQSSSIRLGEVLRYSLPLLVASLWGIVTKSTPQFYISRWFGTSAFAEFSNGFIELPIASMIIGAVGTVLLPVFSRLASNGLENGSAEILIVWKSCVEKSVMLIYPLAIFCCFFATPIMEFLYGNKYSGASIYFELITIINLARVIPYLPIFLALGKVREYAKIEMFCALLLIVCETIYVIWGNVFFIFTPVVITIIYIFNNILYFYLLLRGISRTLRVEIYSLIPFKSTIIVSCNAIISSILSNVLVNELGILNVFMQIMIGMLVFGSMFIIQCKFLKISYLSLIKSMIKR